MNTSSPFAPPRRRCRLAVGGAVLGLSSLLLLDALGWPRIAPWMLEHHPLSSRLSWHPDTRLHLLINPRLRTPQLHMAGGATPRLQAQALELRWRWPALWRWARQGVPLQLRSLRAEHFEAVWQRDAEGGDNWADLRPGAAAQRPLAPPQFEQLHVARGQIDIDDAPQRLRGRLRLGADGDSRWQARFDGHWRDEPLQLRLRSGQSQPLPLLLPAANPGTPEPLQAELRLGATQLRFQGQAASLLDLHALQGDVQVQGPSLRDAGRALGLTLPHTPAYRLTGQLQRAGSQWQLSEARARIGGSRLQGELRLRSDGARPLLQGRIEGGPLRLADLGPAVGADVQPQRQGRVLPDRPFDLPSLRAMDADLQFALSGLHLGSALQPLEPLRTRLRLQDGRLHLEALEAGAAGGRVSGWVQLDSTQSPAAWRTELQLDEVPVERWWRRPDAPLRGALQGRLVLAGRGEHVAALLGSANGELSLRLQRGSLSHLWTELAGLDLAEAAGVWLRGDRPLPLHCAVLHATVRDGRVTPTLARLDNGDSRLRLQGSLDLADERLALRATVHPQDGSPFTLRSPLRVDGSFAQPRVSPAGSALGGRALAALVLAAVAPPAGLLAFVDPGEAAALAPAACPNPAPRPTRG